jgi:hypothetical protein
MHETVRSKSSAQAIVEAAPEFSISETSIELHAITHQLTIDELCSGDLIPSFFSLTEKRNKAIKIYGL